MDFRDQVAHRVDTMAIDQGLRAHMLRVYNYMVVGLIMTGLAAYGIMFFAVTDQASQGVTQIGQQMWITQFGLTLFSAPLGWIFMLAPFAVILVLIFGINRLSFGTAQIVFWVYALLMGVSLSSIGLVYSAKSITQVFFITAATFGALSLYGYTTKKDLTGMGSFMIMGLFGLIIATIVNLFLQSGPLDYAISVIGVLVFAGLTAYDTQRIKEIYYGGDSSEIAGKKAIMGALTLYLDFINLFLMLLRLLGNRE